MFALDDFNKTLQDVLNSNRDEESSNKDNHHDVKSRFLEDRYYSVTPRHGIYTSPTDYFFTHYLLKILSDFDVSNIGVDELLIYSRIHDAPYGKLLENFKDRTNGVQDGLIDMVTRLSHVYKKDIQNYMVRNAMHLLIKIGNASGDSVRAYPIPIPMPTRMGENIRSKISMLKNKIDNHPNYYQHLSDELDSMIYSVDVYRKTLAKDDSGSHRRVGSTDGYTLDQTDIKDLMGIASALMSDYTSRNVTHSQYTVNDKKKLIKAVAKVYLAVESICFPMSPSIDEMYDRVISMYNNNQHNVSKRGQAIVNTVRVISGMSPSTAVTMCGYIPSSPMNLSLDGSTMAKHQPGSLTERFMIATLFIQYGCNEDIGLRDIVAIDNDYANYPIATL